MKSSESTNEFRALQHFSAKIGEDPWQVQGAGGNTSLKNNGVLWIKASGTWLKDAADADLFVPVLLEPLLDALAHGDARAEKSIDFVSHNLNKAGLRPSIETTVHAVLPQKVVVHVHCVDTIALVVQTDAQQVLSEMLIDFNWLWVPYFRPGLPLSRYISAHLEPSINVLVLGNHGLVVAADTIEQAESLLMRVRSVVKQKARTVRQADLRLLEQFCEGTSYNPAACQHTHAVALDEHAFSMAAGGSLYPDHVIFLGQGSVIIENEQSLQELDDSAKRTGKAAVPSIVVPNAGVLMHKQSNASQHAMARCLSDVCLRAAIGAQINYLNNNDIDQLLNWEAETYRQSIAT